MSRKIVVISFLVLLLVGCAVATPAPATGAPVQVTNAQALATKTSASITNTTVPAIPTSILPTSTQTPEAAPTVTVLESDSASGSDITITYIRTSGFLFTSEQG